MIINIKKAIEIIQAGGVVAFPTETVYGLGADATNSHACRKIFETKGRPSINPLIVHVANIEAAKKIGVFNEFSEKLSKLWPGPLTLVMPIRSEAQLATEVTAGLKTIGLRIPNHKIAQEFLHAVNLPIAAPSANISGYISATNLEHVIDDFKELIPVIENNDEQIFGLESTIIDVTTSFPIILREGIISREEIEKFLGIKLVVSNSESLIKSPGMLAKHYSPKSLVRLGAFSLNNNEIGLDFYDNYLSGIYNLSTSGDLNEVAINLYSMLRKIDKVAIENNLSIAISPIPLIGIGKAINDRLKRAATK